MVFLGAGLVKGLALDLLFGKEVADFNGIGLLFGPFAADTFVGFAG